jgi:hypothetical protein
MRLRFRGKHIKRDTPNMQGVEYCSEVGHKQYLELSKDCKPIGKWTLSLGQLGPSRALRAQREGPLFVKDIQKHVQTV